MSEPYSYKTVPMAHQVTEFESSRDKKYWALFWEMGLGKSKTTIDTIGYLYKTGKIKAAVVVAPKGVYRNWEDEEIPKHLPDDIPLALVRWTSVPGAKRRKPLDDIWLIKDKLKILLINVEALATVKGAHYLNTFLKYERPNMLVIDESTTIKTPSAKRSKTAILMSSYAAYRRILTGMPITQSPLDLYNQLRFVDPYALGYSSFFSFRNRFAITATRRFGTRAFNEVVGYKNLDELNNIVHKMGSRLKKEDCLDLPEKIYMTRKVMLTNDQYNIYNKISKDAVLMLESAKSQGILTVALAITAMVKMHQVLCGHVKDDEGQVYAISNNRMTALLDTIEEMSGSIVIWATYRYDIQAIAERLSKEYGADQVVTYYGDTSDDDRAEAKQRFQAKKARFFVGNPQTGGFGITLTAASSVIYYSNSHNLEHRLQSEDRVHRIGQKHSVTYVDLIVPASLDEKILRALRAKENIAKQVVDNYKAIIGDPDDSGIDRYIE